MGMSVSDLVWDDAHETVHLDAFHFSILSLHQI